MIKNIIVETFEEIDLQFKNSSSRKKYYMINKSNIPRTLITIFGEISFNSPRRFISSSKYFKLAPHKLKETAYLWQSLNLFIRYSLYYKLIKRRPPRKV